MRIQTVMSKTSETATRLQNNCRYNITPRPEVKFYTDNDAHPKKGGDGGACKLRIGGLISGISTN